MDSIPEIKAWAEENDCTLDPAIVVHEIAEQFRVTAGQVRDEHPRYRERILARLMEKRQDGQLREPEECRRWRLFGQPLDWIEIC